MKKVLLLMNDDGNLARIVALLRGRGFRLRRTKDEASAQAALASGAYDLMLACDPGSNTAPLSRIRFNWPHLPIIFFRHGEKSSNSEISNAPAHNRSASLLTVCRNISHVHELDRLIRIALNGDKAKLQTSSAIA